MADWGSPTLSSTYSNFMVFLKDRDVDAVTMLVNPPTNPFDNMMRYNRATDLFEERLASVWTPKLISVAGGGTGAATAAGARGALGIGTMGTQNNNAVNITGGNVSGLASCSLSGSLTFGADVTYNLASNAAKIKNAYIGAALVIPVGLNKYATS